MWNAYVIKGLAGGGKAVASFVNYYQDSVSSKFGLGTAFASYIRINIIFSSTDLPSSVSQVAIFLDGAPQSAATQKSYESLKKYSDSQNLVNIVDFIGGYATPATVSAGYDETLGTGRLFNDFWLFKSNFKWSASNFGSSALELNVMIPVASLLLNIASLHVAIYPTVTIAQQGVEIAPFGVFRVMGSHYKNKPKRTADIGSNKNLDSTTSTAFPDDLTTMGNFWSNDLTATDSGTPANSGKGCIRSGETSTSMIKLSTLVSASSLLPFQTYTNNVQIQGSVPYPSGNAASLDYCRISNGNDLTSDLVESSDLSDNSFKIGSAFAIYSRDNIFVSGASLVWSHTNLGQNKCIYHNFCLGGAPSCGMVWTIVCQTDKPKTGSANYGTASSYVTFPTFVVPFYWGYKFDIASKLQYVWSGNTGLGAFVGKDPSSTLAWILKTCTLSTNSGIQKDTMDTSYSLAIANSVTYQLAEASAVTGNSITVQEYFMASAAAAVALKPAYCEFPTNAKISCDLNGNTYVLKNTDSNKIILTSLTINVIVDTVGN